MISAFMEEAFSLGLVEDLGFLQRLKHSRSETNLSVRKNSGASQRNPLRFINKVCRSFPSSASAENVRISSPIQQTLEGVTRLLYLPLFPERASDSSAAPLFWKFRPQGGSRELVIPRVEVSKDDNWFYERPFISSGHRKVKSTRKISKHKSI